MSGGLWATQLAGCAQHIPSSSYLLLLSVPSRTVAPNVREMGDKAWRWRSDIGLSSAI